MATTYTTMQGDTWDVIARFCYGSELFATVLIAANPAHVGTAFFGSGVVLAVPDAQAQTTADATLPPWRRGA